MQGQTKEMHENIKQALQEAMKGSRKMRITFKPEATGYVGYLLVMDRVGIISLSNEDRMVMQGVAESSNWHYDRSRTVTVTIGNRFDENMFVGRMRYALEKIEVVNK